MMRKLKLWGPDIEERERRSIRNSTMTFSSMVNFSQYRARDTIARFLNSTAARQDLILSTRETHYNIKVIQERFRAYFHVKKEQINFVTNLVLKEKQRMYEQFVRDKDFAILSRQMEKLSPQEVRDTCI